LDLWVWSVSGKEADDDAGEGRGGGISTVIVAVFLLGIVNLGKDAGPGTVAEGCKRFFLGSKSFDGFLLERGDGEGVGG
jgi:hypothetical protein